MTGHTGLDTTVTVVQLILAIGALITMVAAVLRFTTKRFEKFVAREVAEATRPIHPDSNGGRSLSDVARAVERMEARQGRIDKKVDALTGLHDESMAEMKHSVIRLHERLDQAHEERTEILKREAARREEWARMLALQGIETPH